MLLLLGALLAPAVGSAQAVSLVGPDGSVEWNRFYTAAETNQIMAELHALYPQLTRLYSIGESYLGQPLMVMEITNRATGAAKDKSALYVDGGIHAGELTGSAVALYLAGHLLTAYGSDDRVTKLLDTRAFYVRPKFNPDGSDLALIQDQFLRSTVDPVDEDDDGTADEDPPEDLNGDGWITMMRIPDPRGAWKKDPADPRVMRRAPGAPGQGRYRLVREGVDNDGDGRINEDGVGGIDMNRNFPRNWERVHIQPGAGPYPLSEPETRATVEFIVAHPNITGIVHGHTSGGFVYRLPSASDPSKFPATDLAVIERLGAEYTRTTGRPVRPSSTDPTKHRYGTLISWAYWDQGIIGWVPEYSPGPSAWVTDYDGDGKITEEESLRFDDEELGGRYFTDWTPFDHPQLGPVEIGGWHAKFWGQNPPPEFLAAECRAQVPWILYLAEQSPMLELDEPVVTALDGGRYRVEVRIRNAGVLPTSVTDRGAVGRGTPDGRVRGMVVRPPYAVLEHPGLEIVEGADRVRVGHLAGATSLLKATRERSRTVEWIVRRTSAGDAAVRVTASSDKAGSVRSGWVAVR